MSNMPTSWHTVWRSNSTATVDVFVPVLYSWETHLPCFLLVCWLAASNHFHSVLAPVLLSRKPPSVASQSAPNGCPSITWFIHVTSIDSTVGWMSVCGCVYGQLSSWSAASNILSVTNGPCVHLSQMLYINYYDEYGSFNRSCMMCTLHLQQLVLHHCHAWMAVTSA